ncbi:carboxymuconolactone decarboxylase family protein [Parafrankia discariae]|uniref:carboxymuconolactone decarboxylase family protein n=1 Tax=Parafrankia discariae TaxID=365528 RepID=UPI00037AE7E3|nr:carboxymuconolactone decarboxylase family protein [Parafrankia discariae]
MTITGTDRAGLGTKDRRWVELVCLAAVGRTDTLAERVYEVLDQDEITLTELLEFVLQCAVYAGWPRGSETEAVVRRQWARLRSERGEPVEPWPRLDTAALGPESWETRLRLGEDMFGVVNLREAPPRDTPFNQAGILGFVFGQVWRRPDLTVRERRLISIGACAVMGTVHPLRHHVRSALDSADLSAADLRDVLDEVGRHLPRPATEALRDVLVQAGSAPGAGTGSHTESR